MSKDEVILLDFWVSPFAQRVKIGLAEKGVEFEAREEDLSGNKSELLLKSNPIYKKVPVLLHNGKAVNESSIIVSYIDDVWGTPAFLPPSAYERATARFWADFIDKKVYEGGNKIWRGKGGDEVEVAKKEFIEILKLLEGALGEKLYFGGEVFGFVDIIFVPMTAWFYAYEQYGGFKVEEETPKIATWIKKCLERKSVSSAYPDPTKVYEFVGMVRKMSGLE